MTLELTDAGGTEDKEDILLMDEVLINGYVSGHARRTGDSELIGLSFDRKIKPGTFKGRVFCGGRLWPVWDDGKGVVLGLIGKAGLVSYEHGVAYFLAGEFSESGPVSVQATAHDDGEIQSEAVTCWTTTYNGSGLFDLSVNSASLTLLHGEGALSMSPQVEEWVRTTVPVEAAAEDPVPGGTKAEDGALLKTGTIATVFTFSTE